MTLAAIARLAASIGPSVANHLWQSTIVAAAAALLARIVGPEHAEVRHRVWLAASLKFLVPVAPVVAAGRYVAEALMPHVAAPAVPRVLAAIGHPFIGRALPPAPQPVAAISPSFLLLVLWTAGTIVLAALRLRQWRRVRALVAAGPRIDSGREREILDALLARTPIRRPMAIRGTRGVEPALVGIRRLVLLWPHDLSADLTDAELASIVAHELAHARRRDNLSALAHIVVETVLWWHPLVWWIGVRLVDARERACDAHVLDAGADAESYARSLLKVSALGLQSRLIPVAGIGGSDLSQRVEAIMTYRARQSLTWGRRVIVAAAIAVGILLPFGAGVLNAAAGVSAAPAVAPHGSPAASLLQATDPARAPRLDSDRYYRVVRPGSAAPAITPVAPTPGPLPTTDLSYQPFAEQAARAETHLGDPAAAQAAQETPEEREFRGTAIRPGTAGLIDPNVITHPQPRYTTDAMRNKISGIAVVEVIVGTDGRVLSARVTSSLEIGRAS